MYNRVALKNRTKRLVRQGSPAPYLVALVYLLATSWVSQIADTALYNPITYATQMMNGWYLDVTLADSVTNASMNAMMQEILSCFQGTRALIGMLASLIILLYTAVVDFGMCGYSLRRMRGEDAGFRDLFSNFDIAAKVIVLWLLKVVFITLWSMLFVIPGLVAAYRYRLAEYLLFDDPELSPMDAIRRSKQMMLGRKMDLFVTDLSFLGWSILLSIATNAAYYLIPGATAGSFAYLAVYTVLGMFLVAYQHLTWAGFYLFILDSQAPPVRDPGSGYPPQHDPNDPYGPNGRDSWAN